MDARGTEEIENVVCPHLAPAPDLLRVRQGQQGGGEQERDVCQLPQGQGRLVEGARGAEPGRALRVLRSLRRRPLGARAVAKGEGHGPRT